MKKEEEEMQPKFQFFLYIFGVGFCKDFSVEEEMSSLFFFSDCGLHYLKDLWCLLHNKGACSSKVHILLDFPTRAKRSALDKFENISYLQGFCWQWERLDGRILLISTTI